MHLVRFTNPSKLFRNQNSSSSSVEMEYQSHPKYLICTVNNIQMCLSVVLLYSSFMDLFMCLIFHNVSSVLISFENEKQYVNETGVSTGEHDYMLKKR